MKRSRKSNRVSWRPDGNLCQVRLFLADDCPSQIGLAVQDLLQEKLKRHSSSLDSEERPPGFEDSHHLKQSQSREFVCHQITWRSPPKFILPNSWQVAAGAESRERGVQIHRELSVLESVYPRVSAIPTDPLIPSRECNYDDLATPVVPITPIEEDEAADITPDVLSAAIPQEPASMVDTDLLVHILSNPKMVESLIRYSGVHSDASEKPMCPSPCTVTCSTTEPHNVSSAFHSSENTTTPMKRLRSAPPPPPLMPPSTVSTPIPSSNTLKGSSSHPLSKPALKITVPSLSSCNPRGPLPVPSSPFMPGAGETPVSVLRQEFSSEKALRPRVGGSIDSSVTPYASYANGSISGNASYYKSLIKQHGGEVQNYGITRNGSVQSNVHGPNKLS